MGVPVGQHGGGAGLAAGGGYRYHRPHPQGRVQRAFPTEYRAHFLHGGGQPYRHGLGRVHDAAAPHGDDKVNALVLILPDGLLGKAHQRVGPHTAFGGERHTRPGQRQLHPAQQAGAQGAAPAVQHQHPLPSRRQRGLSGLLLGAGAE